MHWKCSLQYRKWCWQIVLQYRKWKWFTPLKKRDCFLLICSPFHATLLAKETWIEQYDWNIKAVVLSPFWKLVVLSPFWIYHNLASSPPSLLYHFRAPSASLCFFTKNTGDSLGSKNQRLDQQKRKVNLHNDEDGNGNAGDERGNKTSKPPGCSTSNLVGFNFIFIHWNISNSNLANIKPF